VGRGGANGCKRCARVRRGGRWDELRWGGARMTNFSGEPRARRRWEKGENEDDGRLGGLRSGAKRRGYPAPAWKRRGGVAARQTPAKWWARAMADGEQPSTEVKQVMMLHCSWLKQPSSPSFFFWFHSTTWKTPRTKVVHLHLFSNFA
jgi:hypothetical protein